MSDVNDRLDAADERAAGGHVARARRVQAYVEELQRRIRSSLETVDGDGRFRENGWLRPGGGGGITAAMENGSVFEKAGVNTSAVHGAMPDRMARILQVASRPFFATGISLVIHPQNPHVPTVHANFRYFALGEDLNRPDDEWFGGGADMTPYYPELQDVRHFHRVWKEVCDRHPVADYALFKRRCDEYFYLEHRKEGRGVGGIFFDYLREEPEAVFDFVREAGEAILPAYVPIVERRRSDPFGERELNFQEIRRGRYAEFNLLYDRGTRFGIETGGRPESVLMSLPPRVRWRFDWRPKPDTREAQLEWYLKPRDWLVLNDDDAPGTAAR